MFPLLGFALASEPGVTVVARQVSWARGPASSKPPLDVTLPVVAVADPAVQALLDALLVPETLVGDTREQLIADNWVDVVTFTTTFDHAGILSFRVLVDGTGAWPDRYLRSLVVDVRSGAPVTDASFSDAGRATLVGAVSGELARRRNAADPETRAMIADVTFAPEDLSTFFLTPEGIGFTVRWGLPHALAAGTPDPIVVVPWALAATAIVPGAALERACHTERATSPQEAP